MVRELPEIPEYLQELIDSDKKIDEIKLDKNGKWFHNDEPFTNIRIIDFFNKSICKTSSGEYVISYDKYIYPIIIEDTPIFITGVRFEGSGSDEKIFLNLSTGNIVPLDLNTLSYKNNILYCVVGDDEFPAKFMRSPSYHMLDRLEKEDGLFYLKISGEKILLNQD